jgi:hypothetical protein
MASKIVQPEFFPANKPCHEAIMMGMLKGLFARDAQRDKDIKKLLEMLLDTNQRIDEIKGELRNIVAYDSLHSL